MIRQFEKREAEHAEVSAALVNLKEHQGYLMRVIDEKNEVIGRLEGEVKNQEGFIMELKRKVSEG